MKKRFNTPHRALAAATLLGVGSTVTPNFYQARNVLQ